MPEETERQVSSSDKWADFQRETYIRGVDGQPAPFNTDPGVLEHLAKQKMSESGWSYASSNAGLGWTHEANREAFKRRKIVPRVLRDTSERDTSVEIFGRRIPAPLIFAPVGVSELYHFQGDLPVARVAAEIGLPYCLSTAGSHPIETAAAANGAGPRWFQLYMPHDDELTLSLLTRAANSGYEACILTVDTWQLGWRHYDVSTGNLPPYYGRCVELGLSDPVFQKRLKEAGVDPKSLEAGRLWANTIWDGKGFAWERMPWVIANWKRLSGGRPFLLKGIQHLDDAKKAVEVGCDGIVVSNHAGRQVDGAIASLDALEVIARELRGKTTIIFDSGIRTGADIFKALALGADAVQFGRMWIWGLAVYGEVGVRHVTRSLLAEFDLTMHLAGCKNVGEITKEMLDVSGNHRSADIGN
ncbi:hypothetical protein HK102_007029 [Quaeritorhiza haematococci]|nr:hypothetical protein HK102_007029 [Quaeritorhiza haematococci]